MFEQWSHPQHFFQSSKEPAMRKSSEIMSPKVDTKQNDDVVFY